MTTSPQLGRNNYRAQLARIRLANIELQRCLTKMVEDPGPQTRNVLVSRMALALTDSVDAANELENIGRQARSERP